MPSELDLEMNAIMAAMTAKGGLLECGESVVDGVSLPYLLQAPPTLPAYFAFFCDKFADATFLVDGDTRLTFAETYTLAQSLAGALVTTHGVNAGQSIGLAARNSGNWVLCYMAIIMAGGCATLLNGWWTGDELAQGIALAGCPLVLADDGRAARLAGKTHGANLLIIPHDSTENLLAALGASPNTPTELPQLAPTDPATMLFTSGSTGMAKAAWSDHRAVVQAALNYAGQALLFLTVLEHKGTASKTQPSTLICVPLFHVTGEIPLLLQSFAIGRKITLMPKWDAGEALRLIEAEQVTYFLGVPLMSFELAEHPERARYDLSSCIHYAAGGAPRPIAHVDNIRKNLPAAFPLLGYGLTETNAVGCGNFNENYIAKPTSTGRASQPLVELAILDDAGTHLGVGEVGEVAIRSVCNFRGYWNNPAATAAAITPDLFFRTGDLGHMDADGYLFIVDRKKDIVIRGGENISCIEVEQAIYAHPAVAEASVFGQADARFGEVPVAVWLAKAGETLTETELHAFLTGQLAPYKIPVHLWQTSEQLPRLGTEKVDKRALRAAYADHT
ncbi:MAG: hypothetical protein RLY97_2327 [Pseudomonadota bacterium]|jgi:long-chain acyl-CoA synthetase